MSNAQECLNKLSAELLGHEYDVLRVGWQNETNRVITQQILKRYKPKPVKPKSHKFGDFLDKLGGWILGDR